MRIKTLLVLAACLLLVFLLAGCRGSVGSAVSDAAPELSSTASGIAGEWSSSGSKMESDGYAGYSSGSYSSGADTGTGSDADGSGSSATARSR